MKFNHEYQQHLLQDGFPSHWVESAISYGRLKKVIKRVEQELSSLGLDVQTLRQLLRTVQERQDAAVQDGDDERPFQYAFQNGEKSGTATSTGPSNSRSENFVPKLLFAVDELTGEPVDATLSAETKNYIHQLAISEGLTDVRITDTDTSSIASRSTSSDSASTVSTDGPRGRRHSSKTSIKLVEVPLTTDSEFFTVLQKEVFGLATLQSEEQKQLTSKINELGALVAKLTDPSDSKAKHDLELWRKAFDCYIQSRVFFAMTERDHGAHSFAKAQENFMAFLAATKDVKFKKRESTLALKRFVEINLELLQSLHFQELNQTAIAKIVKKFDKRTGLGIKTVLPTSFTPTVLPPEFAKTLSRAVSQQIISVVPRLDDYLCPICFSVAYRPVRLRCQHYFCIRCLITMQREGKDKCALCRESTVMEADSTNLDPSLAEFLKKYFPAEVKAKQRENEQAVAREQFGDLYDAKCIMM